MAELYNFYAMLDRMQYIQRWGLMRNTRTENLKEHSFDVAVIAHALALIHNRILGKDPVDPLLTMGEALYHDCTEIITGDLLRKRGKIRARRFIELLHLFIFNLLDGDLGLDLFKIAPAFPDL